MTDEIPEVDKSNPGLSQDAPDANAESGEFRVMEAEQRSKILPNREAGQGHWPRMWSVTLSGALVALL